MLDNPQNIGNQIKNPRDMSVEDAPHSRISELNRDHQFQGQPSVLTTNTNEKQEVIASRINSNTSKSPDKYMINNSLVVTLNDSNVTNNSYMQQSSQKRSFGNQFRAQSKNQGSIFPSTTTATTANSYNDQRKSDQQSQQRKGTAYESLTQPTTTSGHQRFKSINGPPQQQASSIQNPSPTNVLYQPGNPLKLNLPLSWYQESIAGQSNYEQLVVTD